MFYDWLQEAGSGECVIKVDLGTEEDQFLSGHAIDGRVLFPATGYLVRKNEIEKLFVLFTKCFVKISRLLYGRRLLNFTIRPSKSFQLLLKMYNFCVQLSCLKLVIIM